MAARAFSVDELHRILDSLRSRGAYRDHLLIRLGTALGFRITELLSVRCGQVWTGLAAAPEITVSRRWMKGGRGAYRSVVRSRRIILAPSVRDDIAEHFRRHRRGWAPDEFLFLSREGDNRPISAAQAHRIVVGAAREAGVDLQRVSTHTLRKTFCARAYAAAQRDLLQVQRLVGHASPVTTARYLESTQAELDELAVLVAG